MNDAFYDTFATQQTADLIMIEVGASCPCTLNHVRNWLKEQCTFDADYMDDAIDMLVEQGKLDVDELGICDLPHTEMVALYKRLAGMPI